MNFGMIMLALLLVCAAVIGIGLIAGSPNTPYVDSYGSTTGNQTNSTQGIITNSTAPLTDAAGGIALVIGFFVVIIAGLFLAKAVSGGTYGQGRG